MRKSFFFAALMTGLIVTPLVGGRADTGDQPSQPAQASFSMF